MNRFAINVSPKHSLKVTTVLCPACDAEIGFKDLVERRGYIACINCNR